MKRMRKVFRSEEGFTLIELLIVIAVLGILAGIAVPRITGVRSDAADSAAEATASSIRNALEMHYAKEGSYPDLDETIDTFASITAGFSTSDVSISVPAEEDYDVTIVTSDADSYDIDIKNKTGNTIYTITPSGITSTP